jgi:hypothetical protein
MPVSHVSSRTAKGRACLLSRSVRRRFVTGSTYTHRMLFAHLKLSGGLSVLAVHVSEQELGIASARRRPCRDGLFDPGEDVVVERQRRGAE